MRRGRLVTSAWLTTTLGWRQRHLPGGYLLSASDHYVIVQLAEVAVQRGLFAAILRRIDRLRGPPVAA